MALPTDSNEMCLVGWINGVCVRNRPTEAANVNARDKAAQRIELNSMCARGTHEFRFLVCLCFVCICVWERARVCICVRIARYWACGRAVVYLVNASGKFGLSIECERDRDDGTTNGMRKKCGDVDGVAMRRRCVTKRLQFFRGKFNAKNTTNTTMYGRSFEWQRKCDDFYDVAAVDTTTYINRRQWICDSDADVLVCVCERT